MNMPCPNTDGRPACCAAISSWCIGLKSPLAPAYMTRSVRVSGWLIARSGVAGRHVVVVEYALTHGALQLSVP